MYIPGHFKMTERNDILAFMKAYPFAAVITAKNDVPVVTHIPVVIKEEGETILLTGHFSKANEQWKEMNNDKVLVVFGGPHAYISPQHYISDQNVPTWNYIAVHAYGKSEWISEEEKMYETLRELINTYEQAYEAQWNNLSNEYKKKMLNGIVCFKITVTDLQGKKKISQNRKETEKENIIDTLQKSRDTAEQAIATYMKQNETHGN